MDKKLKPRDWISLSCLMLPLPIFVITSIVVVLAVTLTLAGTSKNVLYGGPRNFTVDMSEFKADSQQIASFGTRLPNSIGSNRTRDLLTSKLQSYSLQVEYDTFTEDTIIGKQTFTNIIARHIVNPSFKSVILAAHYDSKLFSNFHFIGATDSLIPCVMLLQFAKSISQWSNFTYNVEFMFFDGEEAFVQWTSTDSIYGSRHLAALYQSKGKLERIQSFILLDLLGTGSPTFYNFQMHFQFQTAELFRRLVTIQSKYGVSWFRDIMSWDSIEDDHIPWMQRGVSILHIIAVPFPWVWHKVEDTLENIDWGTTETLTRIFLEFLQTYL